MSHNPNTSSSMQQARGSRIPSFSTRGAIVTGDRELLWSRIRDTDGLQGLLAAIEEAGFRPVVLSRSHLLREGAIDVNFGAILGQLGVFGAVLDYKTVANSVQRELIRLELDLVKLGVSKSSINLLRRQLELAKNVGKAVCLVIDDRAPPATTAKSVFESLEASRQLGLATCGRLPAIIFGGESGTVTRIEDRDCDASSLASSSGDEQQSSSSTESEAGAVQSGELLEMRHKLCSFTDMMLVAYESNCPSAI